jgi:hypothetical protein
MTNPHSITLSNSVTGSVLAITRYFLLFFGAIVYGLDALGIEVPTTLSDIVDSSPAATLAVCPDRPDVVAVYREREAQWWGELSVFHREGETLTWQYAFPDSYEEYRGHYVVRFRWMALRQCEKPVLEVIESTHMGNGALRLWEMEGRTLRLLLEAKVRGGFYDAESRFGVPTNGEAHFVSDHLNVDYMRKADEIFDGIHLSGSIEITDVEGKRVATKAYEQECRWDSTTQLFVVESPRTTENQKAR